MTPPSTITVIEFWRRGMMGNEYISSRLFWNLSRARTHLILSGYRAMDSEELIYIKDALRAVLTCRSVE